MLYGPAGNMRVEISRQMFEDAISSLLARSDIVVELILEEAGLKPSDINNVLLVGGSTRIPLVQQKLEKIFGFAPDVAVNVDECVALGAALHAGLTMLRENPDAVSVGVASGLKDINLTDVCNHSYGTICAPINKETGRRIIQNHIILSKNTPLPCEASQIFYTMTEGQTEVEVTITQGEDTSPEYINKIATQKFELPPNRPAGCPIKVTYSYDVNQRMHCRFEDVQSGRTLEVDFCLDQNGEMLPSDIEQKTDQLEVFTVQ
jgi:molecular chaperone DnaK